MISPKDPDPLQPTPAGAAAGNSDPVIGDADGSVGPMPFDKAAEGVATDELGQDEPGQGDDESQGPSPDDQVHAALLLESALQTWNMIAPSMKHWMLRCQVFGDQQRGVLVSVWTPYAARYLVGIDAIYLAVLATTTILGANIQQAARDPSMRQPPKREPPRTPEYDVKGAADPGPTLEEDLEQDLEDEWDDDDPGPMGGLGIGETTIG